jgi:CRISPR system Cascade subunit CasC
VRENAAPRNLANAFETAVRVGKGESVTEVSAEKLMEKAKKLNTAYAGKGETFVLNLTGAKIDKDFGTAMASLKDLLDKTVLSVKE